MRLRLNRAFELISKFNAEIMAQKDIAENKIKELDEAGMDCELEVEQLNQLNEFIESTTPIQETLEIIIR